jgi:hypothetical protein
MAVIVMVIMPAIRVNMAGLGDVGDLLIDHGLIDNLTIDDGLVHGLVADLLDLAVLGAGDQAGAGTSGQSV